MSVDEIVEPAVGLRERKKLHTRIALIDAAFALFASQGYEATTVDQIAAAVDISPRTFFRYFASKEDVALAPLCGVEENFVQAVAVYPAGASDLDALNACAALIHRDVAAMQDSHAMPFGEMVRLVEASPELAGGHLVRQHERAIRIADALAARAGRERTVADELVVAAFSAALVLARRDWCDGHGSPCTSHRVSPEDDARLLELIDRYVGELAPALDAASRPLSD